LETFLSLMGKYNLQLFNISHCHVHLEIWNR
jgi:hypothetical protein